MTMPALAPSRTRGGITLPAAQSLIWPAAGVVLVLCLHLFNAFGRAINWDEFYHYSLIHELANGTLSKPLQTLQARLFGWVTWLPTDNIGQIIGARVGMFGFAVATAWATYGLARGFTDRPLALLCALAWLSAGFVLQHATSYRTDTVAAALLMTSLAILINGRLSLRDSLLCAACAAIALLLTMKSVLYAPAFAGIAWLRWQEADRTRQASMRLAALALKVPLFFGLFYLLHSAFLPGDFNSANSASGAASKMFQLFHMPYWDHAVKAALTAPVLAVAILAMPVLIWRSKSLGRDERIALIGLALPLTTLLFYHNAAAYYYVFILPPVVVASFVALEFLVKRYSLLTISATLTVSALGMWAIEDRGSLEKQRRIVAGADQIFNEPVAYFDFPAMLGHFPKANAFLTLWGTESYLRSGTGMADTLTTQTVPLVLENDRMLTAALRTSDNVPQLLPADLAMLRDTYIPFWGIYWLAGEALGQTETRNAQIRVPGDYTIRDGQLAINGLLYLPGEVVYLDRGSYQLTSYSAPARLIWGDNLTAPTMPPPDEPFWVEF